jgi:hypothetical protein
MADERGPSLTITFGTTSRAGAKIATDNGIPVFTIFPGFTAGYVEVPFAKLLKAAPFDRLEARQDIASTMSWVLSEAATARVAG